MKTYARREFLSALAGMPFFLRSPLWSYPSSPSPGVPLQGASSFYAPYFRSELNPGLLLDGTRSGKDYLVFLRGKLLGFVPDIPPKGAIGDCCQFRLLSVATRPDGRLEINIQFLPESCMLRLHAIGPVQSH